MRLADHPMLDALCGEWLTGTLRGGARRRFERAMREEPRVAQRVEQFRREFAVSPRPVPGLVPSAAELDRGWARLERELDLTPAAAPWWRGVTFWRGWALTATVVAAVAVWRAAPGPVEAPPIALRPVAELVDAGKQPLIAAALSADARVLELRPVRPIVAGPAQSYELWVIPVEGGAPRSIAVVGDLGARIEVPAVLRERLRAGATLAVSVEPAGGSPTGAPTGPVIMTGVIGS